MTGPDEHERERVTAALEALVDEYAAQGRERLPSERALALTLGVSRNAIRRGLDTMEAERRLVRLPGRSGGAFITAVIDATPIPPFLFDTRAPRIVRDLDTVQGVPQMLRAQGFEPATRIVSEALEPAPDIVAAILGIPTGGPVVSLLRLRLADGIPLSLERMYLDAERFPGLLDHSPIHSLYTLLSSAFGVNVATSDETIEVTAASRQVAGLLGVRPWEPVLAVRRISRDDAGVVVETSVDLFRADRTRLAVSTVRT